jgi:hypothetical protein
MRCPRCLDDHEPGFTTCTSCGTPLLADDAADDDPAWRVTSIPDARLGTFHPAAIATVLALCERRGVEHETRTTEHGVEVLVDRAWRDDLRAELALVWSELVGRLDEDDAVEVLAAGGSTPGWYDPPRGGHVDRTGRLVVAQDEEDADADANRLVGPALVTTGAVLAVVGWWVVGSSALTVLAIGLVLAGLLLPR